MVSVRKRGKVYEYRIEIASIDGVRKWLTKSGFKTRQEALHEGAIAYNEYYQCGKKQKQKDMSYSDYLDYWIENYCKVNLKYNTIQTYKILIKKYIKPKIGYYKLSTITSVSLNNFITELVNENNLSKAYFKNILKVVKGSFRDATNIYGFIKYNPALTIRLPKITKEQKDIKHLYTQEEIDRILKRFKNNYTFTCAFLTSCYTGMRTGEVFALTWEDIDLEKGIINIQHSVYDKPKDILGRWYLGTTKTENSKRKVNICNTLKQALLNYKKYQEQLKELYADEYKYYHLEDVVNEYGKIVDKRIVINKQNEEKINLVFIREDGTYVGTDIIKYPYKIIKNELNIDCRFYDLRGSYATKTLNNGIDLRDIADLLGHRNIETTGNYYISSTEETKLKAINSLEQTIKSNTIADTIKYDIKGGIK